MDSPNSACTAILAKRLRTDATPARVCEDAEVFARLTLLFAVHS